MSVQRYSLELTERIEAHSAASILLNTHISEGGRKYSLEQLGKTSLEQIANGRIAGMNMPLDYQQRMIAGTYKIALDTVKQYTIPSNVTETGFSGFINRLIESVKLTFMKIFSIDDYVKAVAQSTYNITVAHPNEQGTPDRDYNRMMSLLSAGSYTYNMLVGIKSSKENYLVTSAKTVESLSRGTVSDLLKLGFDGISRLGRSSAERLQTFNLAKKVTLFKALLSMLIVKKEVDLNNPATTDTKAEKASQRLQKFLQNFVSDSTTIKEKASEFFDGYADTDRYYERKIAAVRMKMDIVQNSIKVLDEKTETLVAKQLKLQGKGKSRMALKIGKKIKETEEDIAIIASSKYIPKTLEKLEKLLENLELAKRQVLEHNATMYKKEIGCSLEHVDDDYFDSQQ
jgi:hypothetical protein